MRRVTFLLLGGETFIIDNREILISACAFNLLWYVVFIEVGEDELASLKNVIRKEWSIFRFWGFSDSGDILFWYDTWQVSWNDS